MWTLALKVCPAGRCDLARTAVGGLRADVGSSIMSSTREPLATLRDAAQPSADPSLQAPPRTLAGRRPSVPTERLLAELVPPRHFADASFDSYVPDAAHPSQAATVARLRKAADQVAAGRAGGLFRRRA